MKNIVEQLEEVKQKRHEAATRKYSEILLRFDRPHAGDLEALEKAMCEIKVSMAELKTDMHLVLQYRAYKENGGKAISPVAEGCAQDAEQIRRTHRRLFIALEGQEGAASPPPSSASTEPVLQSPNGPGAWQLHPT